jgi:hypothetical protein
MNSYDAFWMAQNATAAAWALALGVDATIQDVESALDAETWPTAMEAGAAALLRVGHCMLLLEGYTGAYDELNILAALALRQPELADELCALPTTVSADRAEAEALLQSLHRHRRAIKERLPFEVASMRTPEGFFPVVGTARQLERLRTAVGLEGFEPEWET